MKRAGEAVKTAPVRPARAPAPARKAELSGATALQSRIGASAMRAMTPGAVMANVPGLRTGGPGKAAVPAAKVASAALQAVLGGGREKPAGKVTGAAAPVSTEPAVAPESKGEAKAAAAPKGTAAVKAGAAGPAAEGAPAGAVAEEGGALAMPGADKAAEAVQLLMPEPPSKPSAATQKRIGGVTARAGGKATASGTLPPAAKQVSDAQQAVTPPDAERAAVARAELMALVPSAPSPEIVALCERIREVIRNKRPPDEDALMEAKPDAAAADAGNQLNGTVQSEAKKTESNYAAMGQSPVGEPAAKAPPVPPQPAAAPTPAINAGAAVPDAVPAQNVSLQADAAAAKKQSDEAGMNTPAAQLVQSGPVAEARAAQGELDQVAQEDPAKVLARQKEALGKAEGDMVALQAQALAALTAARAGGVKKATDGQHGMVASEEATRETAGAQAKAVFVQAQDAVQGLLRPLVTNAMAEWDAARDVLVAKFKADLADVQRRVEERHSGASGFVVGLWDAVTGLPDWAERAYSVAETNFSEGVIDKLKSISATVNSVIAACDVIIKSAREEIARIYRALPASLQAWAAGEQAKFDADLDKLHDQAIAERDSFNKDLIERSSAAVDEVRAEVAELRKIAGGLVGRIVNAVRRFVDDPVKFIIEGLLELVGIPPAAFWAVVAKIKKVVRDIADDPIRFANNLLKGIGEGFGSFFDNFGTHMLKGFLGWLLGDLKDVQIPKDLSLKSIVTFFLQLAGITWPNIRKILVKKIGAKNVALIEKVWSLVSLLIDQGPQGIFEMIKEQLNPQAIVDQIVSMAVDYMVTAIAKQVAVRLLALFNPAGAIVQALEAIYRVLKWVFQNAAKIFTLVETIVNGIADIIAGNTGGFAAAVEKGLAMLVAPVISFIADYFSLGDLPAIVADKIRDMREWILAMIEKAFDWVIEKGKALLAKLGIGKKKEEKKDGTDEEIGKKVHWDADGEAHDLWIVEEGTSIEVMMASEKGPVRTKLTKYAGEVNKLKGPGSKERKERATEAIKTARGILDGLISSAQATKTAGDKPDTKAEDVAAKDAETESWEDKLWPELQTIQIALKIIPLPETVIPSGGVMASTVTAEPLSKKGQGGSGPNATVIGWQHVTAIDRQNLNPKKSQFGPAYWVKAHLVSEWLHGPGKAWNLVPLLKTHNTAMEAAIERPAYDAIQNEEVLYYSASVTYHPAPVPAGFPATFTVEWGTMRYVDKVWERADARAPWSISPLPPPLEGKFIPSLNEVGRPTLIEKGVPPGFARAMLAERQNGSFSPEDFEIRMLQAYSFKGGAAEGNAAAGIAAVWNAINTKKLTFEAETDS